MASEERKMGATCRTCGRNLTLEEFRACAGIGHYCSAHLPASAARATKAATPRRTSSARTKTGGGSRRGRRVSESGVVEYSCKGQFARNGVIRRGRLTTDHPACVRGGAVFVWNDIGYGPGEIITLFIKDPDGRALAERAGFECRD